MINDNPLDVNRLFGKDVPAYSRKAEPTVKLPGPVEPKAPAWKGGPLTDELRKLLDHVELPAGEEFYFPQSDHFPEYFRDSEENVHLTNFDHDQAVMFGQLLSEKTHISYKLPTLQASHDLHNKYAWFRKKLKKHWTWNREAIYEKGYIIPDPVVTEAHGKLLVMDSCKRINAEIYKVSVFDTLTKAGLFNGPDDLVSIDGIEFENGLSYVWSTSNAENNTFQGGAGPFEVGAIAAYVREGSK